jgi:hypothetical protein
MNEPPTKVHGYGHYGGVSKYSRISLFVTLGSNGIKADSKGDNCEVYLTLLQEHMIPACEALMAKRPLAKAQHEWIFQEDNAKAHVRKKVRNWLSSQCGFKVMLCLAKSHSLNWIENMWGIVSSRLPINRTFPHEILRRVCSTSGKPFLTLPIVPCSTPSPEG